jgi:hypothetical protein
LSLDLLRGAALLVSLLAAATAALFAGGSPWLARLDAALEERGSAAALARLAAAARLCGSDPAAAAPQLEELRAENSGYALGDRQERVWAVATSLLAQLELGRGDAARALQLAAEAAAARPRELAFQLQHAEMLRASGQTCEADALLAGLTRLLPEHREVAQRALQLAAARSDWPQAARVLAAWLRQPPALAMEVRYGTAQPDAHALPVQRALLLPRIDAAGRLAAHFRAPAGATTLAVHLPARADFELLEVRLGGADACSGWSDATVAGTGIAGDAARASVSGAETGNDARLVFARDEALYAPADLVLRAEIAVLPPAWLRPFLRAETAAAMVGSLLAAGDVAGADRIDRQRRLLALVEATELRTAGPGGESRRAASLRGGWPETDGIPVALQARIEAVVARVRVPWPRPRAGAADPMPAISFEPFAAPATAARFDRDTVEVVLPQPRRVDAVRAEGRL